MNAVRCAIYTRKSSEEGLEQDFNSLDAQREACAAYIRSQASEGWSELAARYDDGGISGGTLDRPGLQRLLADIDRGLIDIVVVYKVDRLTRSLLDFSKLVERFDAAGTSFVSVTQSFNTTTSMGRLTLNMLLSFAQFEREVTAERIRDKIAASKARGMWMGGTPPLGYRPDGRTLAIEEEHAPLVRLIHRRYRELGTVRALSDWLIGEGILTPLRSSQKGKSFGGAAFSRGQLYSILRNPVYAGNIVHHGKVFPGQHPALLGREEWEAVQAQLTDHVQGTHRVRNARKALLADKLVDADGNRLIAVHTSKGTRRYHYYVSERHHHGDADTGMRIPAQALEQLVTGHIAELCSDPLSLAERICPSSPLADWRMLHERADQLAVKVRGGTRDAIAPLLAKVTVADHSVSISLDAAAVAQALGLARAPVDPVTVTSEAPVHIRRSGQMLKLVDHGGAAVTSPPAESLVRLIVQARRYWDILRRERITIGALAEREGVTPSYATRVTRVAFLAPALVEAIVEGRQPADLTTLKLLSVCGEADWAQQQRMAGSSHDPIICRGGSSMTGGITWR
ncbi:recombinase family protein [Novosphingobium aquae]|uniref:Recombinase family protein n=1 Tax=Novosphingobium aquae TaxID=3133435 RepID=A0ABU8S9J3_9SPHN